MMPSQNLDKKHSLEYGVADEVPRRFLGTGSPNRSDVSTWWSEYGTARHKENLL